MMGMAVGEAFPRTLCLQYPIRCIFFLRNGKRKQNIPRQRTETNWAKKGAWKQREHGPPQRCSTEAFCRNFEWVFTPQTWPRSFAKLRPSMFQVILASCVLSFVCRSLGSDKNIISLEYFGEATVELVSRSASAFHFAWDTFLCGPLRSKIMQSRWKSCCDYTMNSSP